MMESNVMPPSLQPTVSSNQISGVLNLAREIAFKASYRSYAPALFSFIGGMLYAKAFLVIPNFTKNNQVVDRLRDERVTRLELATSTLARLHSTN
jgi:hypothetical protein